MDGDGSGEIDFTEFLAWMSVRQECEAMSVEETAKAMFDIFDTEALLMPSPNPSPTQSGLPTLDSELAVPGHRAPHPSCVLSQGTGVITALNFQEVLTKFGEHLPIDEISLIMAEFDNDGTGEIELEEFEEVVRRHLEER